jgi:putative MATE family efflux protein
MPPASLSVVAPARADRPPSPSRAELFLHGPILPTLLRLSWPNVLVMVAQASTGLIEVWWLARLGTDVLAGLAIVFPVVMLMQTMSGGAMGGGISSAIARALGAGRHADAEALVLHAVIISVVIGAAFSVLVLAFGPPLYRALGGEGASLQAALTYSNVVFGFVVLLWLMNGLASVIRGTGNMLVPALVTCAGVVLLVPLSPCLIFGVGPFPALGVAGGATALVVFYLGATAFFAWYILTGRNAVRLRPTRLEWRLYRQILGVGTLSTINSLQTNLTVAITTALVAHWFGPSDVAGFGTASRLEYLLIPLVFGIGSTLVAMVGMNVGAGQVARARRIALIGGAAAFLLTEAIGVAAAIFPQAWLRLFDNDPAMLASGVAYLRIVGPFYGCFGLGLSLYFAMQGAGRMVWPLVAGFLRLMAATVGGWLALRLTGNQVGLYACLALGLTLYAAVICVTTAGMGKRR